MAEKAKGRKKKSCHLIVHHQPPQMLASMVGNPPQPFLQTYLGFLELFSLLTPNSYLYM